MLGFIIMCVGWYLLFRSKHTIIALFLIYAGCSVVPREKEITNGIPM